MKTKINPVNQKSLRKLYMSYVKSNQKLFKCKTKNEISVYLI